jgi:hypothetical protein
MTNHPHRKKRLSPSEQMVVRLKLALTPSARGSLTKSEAYRLIFESARALSQGVSVDYAIGRILDDLFGPGEIHGFGDGWRKLIEAAYASELERQQAGVGER